MFQRQHGDVLEDAGGQAGKNRIGHQGFFGAPHPVAATAITAAGPVILNPMISSLLPNLRVPSGAGTPRTNCLLFIHIACLLGQCVAFVFVPLANRWIYCTFFRQKPAQVLLKR